MSEEMSKKIIYPNQLNIIINTSVFGYEKIIYKPSMTITDTDEKNVEFNPLIKLNKSVIEKIPKDYRIKQFFNKEMFQSLLIKNGGKYAKSLLQATRSGNVDNNIKVTLDNIFPVGSVIYIEKQPYTIGDVQWTTGDWKIITTKKKDTIRDKIEINKIPKSLRVGNNYSGPPIEENKTSQQDSTDNNQSDEQTNQSQDNVQNDEQDGEQDENELPEYPFEEEELSPEEQKLCDLFNDTFKNITNNNSTNFIKNYFKISQKSISKFSNIIQTVYSNLSFQMIKELKTFLRVATNHNEETMPASKKLQSITPTLYNKLCDQIDILQSPQDSNCFFQAVADSINIYNCENEKSKILYRNLYGKTQLFTSLIIREIVLEYIQTFSQTQIDGMLSIVKENVDDLNINFETYIKKLENKFVRALTESEYLDIINKLYNSNNNFFIKKPTTKPVYIDKYYKPFEVVNKGQISSYILSKDYWANYVAIEAMCFVLGICIITVEDYGYKSALSIIPKQVKRLQALLQDKEQINEKKCFKKVMFLYNSNNHYELIRFVYKNKKNTITNKFGNKEVIYTNRWYTIFKDDNLPPPIYMLFLIYGSIYVELDSNEKQKFTLYPETMNQINESVIKILNGNLREEFIKNFDDTFPRIEGGITQHINIQSDSIIDMNGGNKKIEEENEKTKLAYEITIDMELHAGSSLTPEQIKKSKCINKYNAIRKSFSEFTGKPYVIPPVHKETKKTSKNNPQLKGGRRKTRKNTI
jgi:hypothetical protein